MAGGHAGVQQAPIAITLCQHDQVSDLCRTADGQVYMPGGRYGGPSWIMPLELVAIQRAGEAPPAKSIPQDQAGAPATSAHPLPFRTPPEIEETIDYIMSLPEPTKVSKQYIYLTKSDFGYKIGSTTCPDKRPLQVAGNMPIKLEVITVIEVANSREVERQFHAHFRDKHLRGEWFALDAADVQLVKGYPNSVKSILFGDDIPL